jgi:hypothetical protein
MLRISENQEDQKVIRLRLDGTVNVPAMTELKEICFRYQNDDGKVILLDFAGVVFMGPRDSGKPDGATQRTTENDQWFPFIETLLATVEK